MECHPEKDDDSEDEAKGYYPFLRLLWRELFDSCFRSLVFFPLAAFHVLEGAPESIIDGH